VLIHYEEIKLVHFKANASYDTPDYHAFIEILHL